MGLIMGRRNFTLKHPMWKFYINLSIVSCYFIGALIGAYSLKSLADNQLLINIGLYGVIIILYFIYVKKEKEYRCCLVILGFSTTSEEEEVECKTNTDMSPVPQIENIVEKQPEEQKEDAKQGHDILVSSDEPTVTDENINDVDSDEEDDIDEPLDNQITEEDVEDMEKHRRLSQGGGSDSVSTQPNDIEIKLAHVNSSSREGTLALALVGTTPPPPAAPAAAPKKEMENAWTFRVMMFVVCLLCFNAAFINATTKLSSKEIFTSHITGGLDTSCADSNACLLIDYRHGMRCFKWIHHCFLCPILCVLAAGATTKLAIAISNEDGVGVRLSLHSLIHPSIHSSIHPFFLLCRLWSEWLL
jgi:hypothetical protein